MISWKYSPDGDGPIMRHLNWSGRPLEFGLPLLDAILWSMIYGDILGKDLLR